MMYASYKLNKQGDNIQPWCTHFPIWNQSVVPYPILSVSSRDFIKCTVSMYLLLWQQSHLPLYSWWVGPPPSSPHLCPSSRSARKKKKTDKWDKRYAKQFLRARSYYFKEALYETLLLGFNRNLELKSYFIVMILLQMPGRFSRTREALFQTRELLEPSETPVGPLLTIV